LNRAWLFKKLAHGEFAEPLERLQQASVLGELKRKGIKKFISQESLLPLGNLPFNGVTP
jgi:hypothetical protein